MRTRSTILRYAGRRLQHTVPGLVGLLVLAVAGTAGIAFAAIPGSDGQIHACYAKHGGALRVIDKAKGQHCKADERRVAWNQRGLRGATGAAGIPGATGAPGAAGPPGPAGPVALKYVLSGPSSVAPGEQNGAEVACPSGMSVTGGGLYNASEDTGVTLNASYPFDGDGATGGFVPDDGWAAYVNNEGTETVGFAVYAICTSPTSVS
jgi:hypothetical protein